jgi:uncharacterized protein RhaS with RHS repeats
VSVAVAEKSRDRYYNPAIGRFISEDPIGFGGRDFNLYRYVSNNPIKYSDPAGLQQLNNTMHIGNNLAGGAGGAGLVGGICIINKHIDTTVDGDFDDAQDEFIEELISGGADDFSVDGDTLIGELLNGDKINARPNSSSTGLPTIELQNGKGKTKSKKGFSGGN